MHDQYDFLAILFVASVLLNLVTVPMLFMIAGDRDQWKEELMRRLRR